MKKDYIYIGGFLGIILFLIFYIFFMFLPIKTKLSKIKRKAIMNEKQYKALSFQLESMDVNRIIKEINSLRDEIDKYKEYRIKPDEITSIINTIAKIPYEKRINLVIKEMTKERIRKKQRIISKKDGKNDKPSSKIVPIVKSDSAPPPPPPPGSSSSTIFKKTFSTKKNKIQDVIKWEELPIYIEMEGEYIDIAKFFYYLSNIKKIVLVEFLEMAADNLNTGKVNVKLRLVLILGEEE